MPKPFEVGKTYKTRSGADVRVLAVDRLVSGGINQNYTVVGLMRQPGSPLETTLCFSPTGECAQAAHTVIPEREELVQWYATWWERQHGAWVFKFTLSYSETDADREVAAAQSMSHLYRNAKKHKEVLALE